MKIRVRFFALAREIVGASQLEMELPEGTTVQALNARLLQTYPRLATLALRFAVNARYAGTETLLNDGDEVAYIPPVGGG